MFVIVNYGVGNLVSIQNMLKKAGVKAIISSNQADIEQADKILLPGMGAFDNCMIKLNQSGLRPSIEHKAHVEKVSFLGICVGLQMLMASSEEGVEKGLGWIDGETIMFKSERMQGHQKIPNMGWLEINVMKSSPLMDCLNGSRFYFAHSYHVKINDKNDELISAHYGYDFTAGVERGNILGVQFHPEKSHRFGLQLFKNFAENY